MFFANNLKKSPIGLGIKKSLKYQALLLLSLTVLFYFYIAKAENSEIIINEIQISGGSGKTSEDYIELYNKSSKPLEIGGWKIRKRTQGGTESSIKVFSDSAVIPAEGYFLWANSSIAEKIKADEATGSTVSANNSVALLDDEGKIIDQVAWGSGHVDPFVEGAAVIIPAGQPERIERKNFQDTGKNSEDFAIISSGSPAPSGCLENPEKCAIKGDEPTNLSDDILITELLPDPGSDNEEYIEIYNGGNESLNLEKWELHDATKTGKYVFETDENIGAKEYFVVYKTKYKFALNNSGQEKIYVLDPSGKEISSASYNGSKENISYNFDGRDWHWSKFLTPGKKNIFEDVPEGELDIDDEIYADVYANFAILGLSKKAKVTWDFGDGHKSYLQETRHKYAETGKYAASVKYSEGSEDVVKNFTIEVKKIKHPEVKIVAVNANPEGSDTDNETITVRNKSKKKINLNGWSIATGWKKLINHPITEDFEIKAGKEKEITREISKFTLNNKKTKIELRYPDGEVAHKMKYKKENKGIAEGEIYQKVKGGWVWIQSQKSIKSIKFIKQNAEEQSTNYNQLTTEENEEPEVVEGDAETMVKKKEIPVLLMNSNSYMAEIELLNNQPRVLGAETVREIDGQYLFTPNNAEQEHYVIVFAKNLFFIMNEKINLAFNFFFQ
jgi:hypothetical protein